METKVVHIKANQKILDIFNNKSYKNTNDMMVDVIVELKRIKLMKERRNKLKNI